MNKNLLIFIILITIAIILTIVAAEIYNQNLSFVYGVFVGCFAIQGSYKLAEYVNEKVLVKSKK